MYILQFCNTFTQETIREESYKNLTMIDSIIKDFTTGEPKSELYLADRQLRIFKAEYISYKIYNDENDKIYRFFFKVKLVDMQALMKNR